VVVGLLREVESYRPRARGGYGIDGGGMVVASRSRRAGGGGGAGAGDGFLLELLSRFGRSLGVTCHQQQPKLDGRTDPTIVELAWRAWLWWGLGGWSELLGLGWFGSVPSFQPARGCRGHMFG
jgi:hypothetical protein